MLTVDEAIAAVLGVVRPFPPERVPLSDSLGLVLAEDILADADNPRFDNSAVDGFAVRSADVVEASERTPVPLRELAPVMAGGIPREPIVPGACMRVMTGAPIPAGADAMVMREDARESPEGIEILAPASPGDHMRWQGENVRRGSRVLAAGTRIGPAEIGMLAMMGAANPLCVRRPRMAALSTGDELVDVGASPAPGQIRDSNRYALAALAREAGADLHSTRHLPDDLDATVEALRTAAGFDGGEPADVLVTSGGVSVGDRDFVKPAVESIGRLDLWRVAMKPGKPVAFGRIARPDGGETLFFGLPGNPVSTIVTFELFVRPALWKLAGRSDLNRPRISVRLSDPVEHRPGRQEFVRATAVLHDGEWTAGPTAPQPSHNLGSMLGANALIVVPADSGDLPAGAVADAMLLELPATD